MTNQIRMISRLQLACIMITLMSLSSCHSEDEPTASAPFDALNAVEAFDGNEIDFYLNDERIRNDDVVLYMDTL